MRTTLTLDDDVAARLSQLNKFSSFKEAVNTLLRMGLDQLEQPCSSSLPSYQMQPVQLGAKVKNLDNVAEVLNLTNVWVPQPTEQHSDILGRLLLSTQSTANLVPDAHLAALAIEHGLEIHSTDSDFAKFPDCRWHNPLTLQ
jgi:hypothetical protein